MGAHPVRERLMVADQRRIVAPLAQPRRLRIAVHVEQAHSDGIEVGGGRRGDNLAGGDGISGEQQVPTLVL